MGKDYTDGMSGGKNVDEEEVVPVSAKLRRRRDKDKGGRVLRLENLYRWIDDRPGIEMRDDQP